jgi:hypothetical protein
MAMVAPSERFQSLRTLEMTKEQISKKKMNMSNSKMMEKKCIKPLYFQTSYLSHFLYILGNLKV